MRLASSDLGRRLVAARVLAGLTQERVIERARGEGVRGLSSTAMSEMENGKREPQLKTLRWLCDLYGVDMTVVVDPDYRPFRVDAALAVKVEELSTSVARLAAQVRN